MKIKYGDLPETYIECFEKLSKASQAADLEYMLVGATARDLVFENVYGIQSPRRTYDIDISLYINSWEKFEEFKAALEEIGFSSDPKTAHKMSFLPSNSEEILQLDLVPFGPISDVNGDISRPPGFDLRMSVLGFEEGFRSKLIVDTNKDTKIPVVSIEGLFLLKLIAWIERGYGARKKDAEDLFFILQNYEYLDGMRESLFNEIDAEHFDFDLTKISVAKLAREVGQICTEQTYKYINSKLINDDQEEILEQLANEMSTNPALNLSKLIIFRDIFKPQ